jgi:hypothetical protein
MELQGTLLVANVRDTCDASGICDKQDGRSGYLTRKRYPCGAGRSRSDFRESRFEDVKGLLRETVAQWSVPLQDCDPESHYARV